MRILELRVLGWNQFQLLRCWRSDLELTSYIDGQDGDGRYDSLFVVCHDQEEQEVARDEWRF